MRWLSRVAAMLALALRQLVRSPRRTVLTFTGLVISFFLYTALESVLYTLESVVERTASQTAIFWHRWTLALTSASPSACCP